MKLNDRRTAIKRLRLQPSVVALAVALAGALFLANNPVHAQGLQELYQSARSYDATCLAARADALRAKLG